jgi:hypothetical protein
MRFFITFFFCIELLFIGCLFTAAHFKKHFDFIPVFALKKQDQVNLTEKNQLLQRSRKLLSEHGDSVQRFEDIRQKQLEQLAMAENLTPAEEEKFRYGVKVSPEENKTPKKKIKKHLDIPTLKQDMKETFVKFNPQYHLLWFGAMVPLPIYLRFVFFIPILGFPFVFLGFLFNRKKDKNAKVNKGTEFIKLVSKNQFDKAYALWDKDISKHELKQYPEKLQSKWLEQLLENEKFESATRWGFYLINKFPENSKINKALKTLLSKDEIPVELSQADIYSQILVDTEDKKLAQRIWDEKLKDYPGAQLEIDIRLLAGNISNTLGNPEEIESFIADRS